MLGYNIFRFSLKWLFMNRNKLRYLYYLFLLLYEDETMRGYAVIYVNKKRKKISMSHLIKLIKKFEIFFHHLIETRF